MAKFFTMLDETDRNEKLVQNCQKLIAWVISGHLKQLQSSYPVIQLLL
jgi:hypothetical protein